MAFKIENIIFGLFGSRDKREDLFKDGNDKGLNERFQELLGKDFDDDEGLKIINFVSNLSDPRTVLERMLTYLEQQWGDIVVISQDLAVKRKILQFATRLYRIKGTKSGYETLFRIMGFDTVVITEQFEQNSFDSPITFDDVDRVFDRTCPDCSEYKIALTGTLPVTDELINNIFNVVKFNEPINAVLNCLTYNGNLIVQEIITIFIDAVGDLIYDNTNDPTLVFEVDENGDLIASGPNAGFYSIDDNGDMIYTP